MTVASRIEKPSVPNGKQKPSSPDGMIDSFGRRISYLRMSVTDRCDLRCRYCMAEDMTFLPKRDVLSLEELLTLADIFIARGIRKIRLTGGEPLVRRGVEELVRTLGRRIGRGLDELTLTTNGTQLDRFAPALAEAGIRRINVSLDTLDPQSYHHITRRGDLHKALRGIAVAANTGLSIKINMVAMAGINDHEIEAMMLWCADRGYDLTLIETMPLGEVDHDRADRYLPLDAVLQRIEDTHDVRPTDFSSGGPARYYQIGDIGLRLGLITPLTGNFCGSCNRIRIAATGTVFGCLGHDQKVELRDALREGGKRRVNHLVDQLITGKPRQHEFDVVGNAPAVSRHMSVTGG